MDIRNLRKHTLTPHEQHYKNIESLLAIHSLFDFRSLLPSMRGDAISPEDAVQLLQLILDEKPKNIIQLGSGVSSLLIGYALEKLGQGHLTAINHLEFPAHVTQTRLQDHQLDPWISVLHAPLTTIELTRGEWTWYETNKLRLFTEIDLLIINGPYHQDDDMVIYPALPFFFNHLSPHAFIVILNARNTYNQQAVFTWQSDLPLYQLEVHQTEQGLIILQKLSDPVEDWGNTQTDW